MNLILPATALLGYLMMMPPSLAFQPSPSRRIKTKAASSVTPTSLYLADEIKEYRRGLSKINTKDNKASESILVLFLNNSFRWRSLRFRKDLLLHFPITMLRNKKRSQFVFFQSIYSYLSFSIVFLFYRNRLSVVFSSLVVPRWPMPVELTMSPISSRIRLKLEINQEPSFVRPWARLPIIYYRQENLP